MTAPAQLLGPVRELAELLQPYADAERTPPGDRPWVLANMVAGLDGTAAAGGRVGGLTDPLDQALFADLRSVADVILVGAGTVRAERYGPVRLRPELVAARRRAGRPARPRLAIVSRSLDLDWESKVFAEPATPEDRPIVVTCTDAPPDARERAGDVAEVVAAGGALVELGRALTRLGDMGTRIVLCEGGPSLLGELVALDLLDELCLTIAPVMGGDPLPVAVVPRTTPDGARLQPFTLAHAVHGDGSLFLRYLRASDRG